METDVKRGQFIPLVVFIGVIFFVLCINCEYNGGFNWLRILLVLLDFVLRYENSNICIFFLCSAPHWTPVSAYMIHPRCRVCRSSQQTGVLLPCLLLFSASCCPSFVSSFSASFRLSFVPCVMLGSFNNFEKCFWICFLTFNSILVVA